MIKIGIFVVLSCLCELGCSTGEEVFLGGSCNPTTWRKDTAIPALDKLHITYYNPQVDDWSPKLVKIEEDAKENARVLLFVMDEVTRNVVSMIEVSQLSVTRSDSLFVVMSSYQAGQAINKETISTQDYNELVNGLGVLRALLKLRHIPVYPKIPGAIEALAKVVNTPASKKSVVPVFNNPSKGLKDTTDIYVVGGGSVMKELTPKLKSSEHSFKLGPTKYKPESLKAELELMRRSRIILLVVPQDDRALDTMILAAHLIGLNARLVLCIQNLSPNAVVSGAKISESEIKDYNRGRPYVIGMAEKAGVPVHVDPKEALRYAISKLLKE